MSSCSKQRVPRSAIDRGNTQPTTWLHSNMHAAEAHNGGYVSTCASLVLHWRVLTVRLPTHRASVGCGGQGTTAVQIQATTHGIELKCDITLQPAREEGSGPPSAYSQNRKAVKPGQNGAFGEGWTSHLVSTEGTCTLTCAWWLRPTQRQGDSSGEVSLLYRCLTALFSFPPPCSECPARAASALAQCRGCHAARSSHGRCQRGIRYACCIIKWAFRSASIC